MPKCVGAPNQEGGMMTKMMVGKRGLPICPKCKKEFVVGQAVDVKRNGVYTIWCRQCAPYKPLFHYYATTSGV